MRRMADTGKLTRRYAVYLPGMNLQSGEEARRLVQSWGVKPEEGDAWVRVDGIKIMVDGGFAGGHLAKPYAEPYGKGGAYRGIETITPERFKDICTTIICMYWHISVHTAGVESVTVVLSGFNLADERSSIPDHQT